MLHSLGLQMLSKFCEAFSVIMFIWPFLYFDADGHERGFSSAHHSLSVPLTILQCPSQFCGAPHRFAVPLTV
jgi:hypothetical protein